MAVASMKTGVGNRIKCSETEAFPRIKEVNLAHFHIKAMCFNYM